MAGIFANIDSDIQKLQKLKQEIENVKKSLKSINVKVNIDIAQGLEAQLKSLTTQYNALAAKVGETEAKITASTKKIIEASNKIVQAQEKMSQATKVTNVSSSTTASTSANASETVSIQAQTKAYEDLEAEIGDIIGTRGQNIKRLIEEQNAIRLINAEIKKIMKSQGESATLSSTQQKRLEQLNNSLLTHKIALSEVRQNLNANAKLDNAAATSMNALTQSLARMRTAYRSLTEEELKSPFGKELLASIQQADAKIKQLNETIGNHQLDVGNYAKAFNGLNISIQQIGRELPSLAYGPRVFFSAISNNIGPLADALKRANVEYKSLTDQGQKAVPVWKQIATSLFSWQTALTVGITLLTLYGDKLVKWISSLGKTEKAIKNLYTVQRDLYNVTSAGIEQSSKEITKLNSLYKIATDVTKSTKERNNAVRELKKSYPEHLKNLSDEKIKNGEVSKAIKEQTSQIIANAKATAAADQIAKNWYKSFQAGVSKNIAYITKQRLEQELAAKEATVQQLSQMRARPESYVGLSKDIEGIKEKIEETDKEIRTQENLQDSYQKSSKALEKLVTVSGVGGKYEDLDKNYNSIVDQQKKISELLDKQTTERKRKEQDLENQLTQSRIDAMAEGEAKIRAQRELDNKKEIQDLERQREDYIRTEIELQRKAFDEQENLRAKQIKNYKKRTFDESAVKVDTSAIDEIIKNTQKKQEIAPFKEELSAMNDYLKEYGTFMQRKLAITQEYEEKIKNAQNQWEARALSGERDTKLSSLKAESIKANIDWATVFGEFGGIFREVIKPSLEEAKKYVKTEDFKNSDQASQKELIDAINQMEKSLGGTGALNFKKLGQEVQNYQNSLRKLQEAEEEVAYTSNELKKAQENYEKAIKSGTEEEKKAAKHALDVAEMNSDAATTNAKAASAVVQENQQTVSQTATNLNQSMQNVSEGLSKLASGGLKNAYDGLIQAGKGMGGAIEKVSDKLEDIPIIGWILSIIDVLKDGLSNLVGGLLDAIFNAVGGIIDDVLSGDLFVTIGKSIGNGLMNIGRALGEGLSFGLLDLGGADYSDYNEMKQKYEELNEIWDELIDKKKEYIDMSYGPEAAKAGDEAISIAKKSIESYKILGRERLQSGASAGSHSIGVRIRNSMSQELWDQWDEFAKSIGKDPDFIGGRLSGLFDLTAEQLEKLKEEAPGFWSKLDGDVQNYLNKIIEGEERIEDIQKAVQEQLTQTSFDSLFDSFIDTLMDMDASSKDFADNFGEYMRKAIFTQMFAKGYEDELRKWYGSFSAAMGKEGGITSSDIKDLREGWDTIVNGALEDRKAWEQIVGGGGTSTSQESSKKGFATMSQDSADELNGRFTALQIAGEEIKNQNQLQTMSILELKAGMLTISANSSGIKDIASETRDLIRLSYEAITDIRDNTNVMVKPIQQMAADIAEVKRNTNGLSKR